MDNLSAATCASFPTRIVGRHRVPAVIPRRYPSPKGGGRLAPEYALAKRLDRARSNGYGIPKGNGSCRHAWSSKRVLPRRLRGMKREFYVVIEQDEDGVFVGEVPQLRGCYTQGKTLDDLMANIREVIELCLEDEPETTFPEFLGVQKVVL
jgi:predicted RNase H-like HicB family nuclease